MRPDTWAELLEELIHATDNGLIHWKPTDRAGSFIVPFGGNSVIIRGVPNAAGMASVTQAMLGRPAVEIRDPSGNMLAVVGSGLAVMPTQVATLGEDEVVTVASELLRHQIDRLAAAVRRVLGAGEEAARDIIDELRDRRRSSKPGDLG